MENDIILSELARKSKNTEHFLNTVADRIVSLFHAQIASIFIFSRHKSCLSLLAHHGLRNEIKNFEEKNKDHSIEIPIEKGIVGMLFRNGEATIIDNALEHPNFMRIEGLSEHKYPCYLSTVLRSHQKKIGLLLVQREKGKFFSTKEKIALENIGASIADLIEEARVLILAKHSKELRDDDEKNSNSDLSSKKNTAHAKKCSVYSFSKTSTDTAPATDSAQSNDEDSENKIKNERFFYNGEEELVIGRSTVLNQEKKVESLLIKQMEEHDAKSFTLGDFHKALKAAISQVEQIQQELNKDMDNIARDVFAGHLLILKDIAYIEKIEQKIKTNVNVPQAIFQVTKVFERIFSRSEMTAIQEKVLDLRDISRRILANLLDKDHSYFQKMKGRVLITKEIYPSQLMFLANRRVAAVLLASKVNSTSHIALIARSLSLPLISIPSNVFKSIKMDDEIAIDFYHKMLYINPEKKTITVFRKEKEARRSHRKTSPLEPLKSYKNGIFYTVDGARVKLLANINLPRDISTVKKNGIPIGLYRSEFLFMLRNHFPSEVDQYNFYRKIFKENVSQEIVIRMLDIGGDKMLSQDKTENSGISTSALGLRSMRYLLANPEILTTQLRAIFLASHDHHDLKLLVPFISSVEEIKQVGSIVEKTWKALQAENIPVAKKYSIGMMLEIPAVVFMMESFAKEVDFFSIGTNDLAQFILAADRNDEKVSQFFSLHHPALLRAVKTIICEANRLKREVTLCGTMAESPLFIPFLLGCGLRRFSVQLANYHSTVKILERSSQEASKNLVDRVLALSSQKEILKTLQRSIPKSVLQ